MLSIIIIIKNSNSCMNIEECVGFYCILNQSHWQTWSHWLDCIVLLVVFYQMVVNFYYFLLHKKNILWYCEVWSSKCSWIKVNFTDFIYTYTFLNFLLMVLWMREDLFLVQPPVVFLSFLCSLAGEQSGQCMPHEQLFSYLYIYFQGVEVIIA